MAKTGTLSPATIQETERPRANPKILYRELKTGCVLYHPGTNEAHVLNLAAAYIWTCCDGEREVSTIVSHIAEVCRLPLSQAQRDVKKALRDFHVKKLLL